MLKSSTGEIIRTRLLSLPELKSIKGIGFSRAHLDRLIKVGKFPKPIKIGDVRNAWIEREIDSYIASRIAERDAAGKEGAANA